MKQTKRIIIAGHPGAGKSVLGEALAEKLGWKFIDVNFDLENLTGAQVNQILGDAGNQALRVTEKLILSQQPDNTVIVTDVAIVTAEENVKYLMSEYVVFVTVSLPVQLERMSRHVEPLLVKSDRNQLLRELHNRDKLFNEIASITINTDDNALHSHVDTVLKDAGLTHLVVQPTLTQLSNKDLVLNHLVTYQPVQLTKQQAVCIKLLAQGKSAKEIAQELDISHRTVEGYIAKAMELLGCSSSKELISLYLGQP